MSANNEYISALIQRFWDYVEAESIGEKDLLDSDKRNPRRPPVFQRSSASHNILISPDANQQSRQAIVSTLATKERHRHFDSITVTAGD